jgi:Putative peptidoglycan-binding domain-containing protein
VIVLVGWGYWGWYDGWWYPAWGYDPYYSYYDYDGPIYGYDGLQPDEIIADVQAALQQLGYYAYAVDGVLGPATEAAIANYQRDYGLSVTGAIDPATVRLLGLRS